MQRVINAATRLVCGLRPRDHVTAATISLHWLPAEARIQYKLCLMVHLSLAGKTPEYISDMIRPLSSVSSRATRATTNHLLYVPRCQLKFGERSFSVAAPEIWNSLPPGVRDIIHTVTFKKQLKRYLFTKFYDV